MKIVIKPSGGIAPKVAPRLLPDSMAQVAQNCRFGSGELRAWREPLLVGAISGGPVTQSLYLFDRTDDSWFAWPDGVDVARSALASTTKRTYYTGDGVPKVTDTSLAGGGGVAPPAAALPLGIPAPSSAITLVATAYDTYSAAVTYAVNDYVMVDTFPAFVEGTVYYFGNIVSHDGDIYSCIVAETKTPWDAAQWSRRDAADFAYRCDVAVTVAETFDPSKWTLLQSVDKEARAYVVTHVSGDGEEGAPSDPSEILTIWPEQEVTLTIPAAPGGYNITKKRLYRTNTGSSRTDYQFLAEVGAADVSYVDTVPSATLGEVLLTSDWAVPPANLQGLIALPNGCMAGFFDKTLCFSVPYQPHAWPVTDAYRRQSVDTIVSIAAFGMSILVTTTGYPAIVTGSDPATMSMEKLESGFACVSKRGTVDMGSVIIYPSVAGLVAVGTGMTELVTADIYTRDEWAALKPESIHAYHYDGMYIGFYDTGSVAAGFCFNPADKSLTPLDLHATAGFYDHETGELFLCINEELVQWQPLAGEYIPYVWRSKLFTTEPVNFSAAKVIADNYPLTLRLYANGTLRRTKTVVDDRPFRLPGGYRAENWAVELTGTAAVYGLVIAEGMGEI